MGRWANLVEQTGRQIYCNLYSNFFLTFLGISSLLYTWTFHPSVWLTHACADSLCVTASYRLNQIIRSRSQLVLHTHEKASEERNQKVSVSVLRTPKLWNALKALIVISTVCENCDGVTCVLLHSESEQRVTFIKSCSQDDIVKLNEAMKCWSEVIKT